jgi:hypothetical protein
LLRAAGFLFRATPVVIQELEAIRSDYRREYTKALAQNLLETGSFQQLGVITAPLSDTEHDVTEIHAKTLMAQGVTAGATTINNGDMVALLESAYGDCPLFVTQNPDLLERSEGLSLALIQTCGMRALLIVAPDEIVEAFKTPA